jgi:hypothetical protein
MRGVVAAICVGLLVQGLAPRGAAAQDGMGLAGIHEWVKVGGKTCMADHFHDGQGTGPTKAQAQAAAIRAWVDFTAWEYGRRWAKWQNSVAKSSNCSGTSGNISCSVSSRPCTY